MAGPLLWYSTIMRAPSQRSRHWPLIGATVAAMLVVAALSIWGAERESRHAVQRLALSQATLARALVMDFENRVAAERAEGHADDAVQRATDALLRDSLRLGEPRETLVFVNNAGSVGGPRASLPPSLTALVGGSAETAIIPRDEAAALGLPLRRAVAAWSPAAEPTLGVLVVASASGERLRAEREELFSIVSLVVLVGIVLAFGIAAVRREGERVRLAHVLERQQLERERDEQLARAERIGVASALSLGIAHELATPLGVISARVEGLRRHTDEPSTERSSAALAVINEQVNTMRQIMQGFLSLARGTAAVTTQVAPQSLARAAAKAVLHRFSAGSVNLHLEAPESLPQVWADETLVRQALTNLLVNAAQASAPGSQVTLRVSVVERWLEFRVIDQGHGIAPEVINQVTQPFVTTRAQLGGTGLGLAITQELARHHGGTMRIEARKDGPGTEASLRLPLSAGDVS